MDWNRMVRIGCSADAYNSVVKKMFQDQCYTVGRYTVLQKYTMDICKMEPNIAEEIRASHEAFLQTHPIPIQHSFYTRLFLSMTYIFFGIYDSYREK